MDSDSLTSTSSSLCDALASLALSQTDQSKDFASIPSDLDDSLLSKGKIEKGTLLNNGRYEVICSIGKGAFGKVVKALDLSSKQTVAVKIIRNEPLFQTQAKSEIEILGLLREADQEEGFFVKMLDTFTWRGVTCIVFEYLAKDFYQLLKETNFQGFPLETIRIFAWQLLTGLSLLALPNMRIIHSDLKPENIMLKTVDRAGIKIIDFGSSYKGAEAQFKCAQSRYYRAPEVLLGLPYSNEIDVWSLGCILIEMHAGRPLFPGSNSYDQMQKIVNLRGFPNKAMLRNSQKASHYFNIGEKITMLEPYKPKSSKPTSIGEFIEKYGIWQEDYISNQYFIDLIDKMLQLEPNKRITAQEALRHPFFFTMYPTLVKPVILSPKNTLKSISPDSEFSSPFSKKSTAPSSNYSQDEGMM